MTVNVTEMVQHFTVLARPRDIALGLATRMVLHAHTIEDLDALSRWGVRRTQLEQPAQDLPA